MSLSVLQLVQQACQNALLPYPSTLVSPTDQNVILAVNLFHEVGRDLRSWNIWPQLKRRHTLIFQAGRNMYPLPGDFYSGLPGTEWDQQNRWQIRGPMGDQAYNFRTYGYTTVENRKAYRNFGPDINPASTGGQFMMDPIPGASSAGYALTFEYLSKSWLLPPNWIASTSYTLNTSYVNVNGNVYRCATAGSNNSGTNPPSVGDSGIGRDGGVQWLAITPTAWGSTTLYAPFDFVTNGGNLYVCTTGGTSAGSGGPTGTSSSSITDGTVSWSYCTVTAWAGQTTFGNGTFTKAGSNYFKAVTPPNTLASAQITGKNQPTWVISGATWKETDGSTSWNYQTGAYEALITDNDLCLFDDDLMILGLQWRLKRAKRMEYLDLAQEYTSLKSKAIARFNAGEIIDLASGGYSRFVNIPESFNI